EFLSRFVWIMRKRLVDVYPDFDKKAIDGMLVIIVEKVVSEVEKGGMKQLAGDDASAAHSTDFSEDLWKTVWEVSNQVLQDIEKEKKKEKMKTFLHSEDVKKMYRFAGEVGIRGDMLRELRFKWAREKMEETEFYDSLERIRKEASEVDSQKREGFTNENAEFDGENEVGEERSMKVTLPKRHGNLKYKIYGLDLSHPKWAEVADKIHENDEVIWPVQPKSISGKCKLVTEKILSLQEGHDPTPLLDEWIRLLQPSRIDWIALLDKLKSQHLHLYFKISEHVLTEASFNANVHDYSKLIDALAKEKRIADAERILKKMDDNGIPRDIITSTIVMQMYCISGNIDQAKQEFESLRARGYRPDVKAYSSMIMAYVNAGKPKLGENLMREMETRDMKVTKEIYMALLQSFAEFGDASGADRISATMQFSGLQPSLESCTLMVMAYARAGDPENARYNFDQMMKMGIKPDDRCVSHMISAYQKNNSLDKALNLLLEIEKDGVRPGVFTYTALVDWLTKLELFDEAEQVLDKMAEQVEAPPFELHISLCDMYSKTGNEKKALQALGVVESKMERLDAADFSRIIASLEVGGFWEDSKRVRGLMEGRGF
ncbi:hypothetical protein M569_12852, partial [Genlisea aurea]